MGRGQKGDIACPTCLTWTHSLRHNEQKKSQKVKGSDWSWVKKIAHTQRVPHASNATNTA